MALNNYWLDANIILRYLTKDNETLSPKAKTIIDNIANCKGFAYINTLVLHEVIYILENVYNIDRKAILDSISNLISISNINIVDVNKQSLKLALKDYVKTKIDFPDCVYKQVCLENKYKLLSFDKDFEKLGVKTYETI
ncbi:MAG: PIN domain-containing protein [bacterium]|nr:PIN domain-containing protein [bacterium]